MMIGPIPDIDGIVSFHGESVAAFVSGI